MSWACEPLAKRRWGPVSGRALGPLASDRVREKRRAVGDSRRGAQLPVSRLCLPASRPNPCIDYERDNQHCQTDTNEELAHRSSLTARLWRLTNPINQWHCRKRGSDGEPRWACGLVFAVPGMTALRSAEPLQRYPRAPTPTLWLQGQRDLVFAPPEALSWAPKLPRGVRRLPSPAAHSDCAASMTAPDRQPRRRPANAEAPCAIASGERKAIPV
jgi:hypothetical protein